jgi:hypothetical protein
LTTGKSKEKKHPMNKITDLWSCFLFGVIFGSASVIAGMLFRPEGMAVISYLHTDKWPLLFASGLTGGIGGLIYKKAASDWIYPPKDAFLIGVLAGALGLLILIFWFL